MIQSTYKGLPYLVTRDEAQNTPICTVALFFDLRRVTTLGDEATSVASLRQTLRTIWRMEERLRSDILYQHTGDDLLILFRSVLNDKHTLDSQLATIARFMNQAGAATGNHISEELDKFLAIESQSDPSYTFQDLVEYHVYGKHRNHFVDLPPRPPLMSAEGALNILNNSPTALICFNGNEQRCRYMIKRLWPDRRTLAQDPKIYINSTPSKDPAQSLCYDYQWKHCENTAYSATLWPADPNDNVGDWLCSILGGGFAFSSGGPGKGLLSRFHQKVLPMVGVQSAAGLNLGPRHTGFEISAAHGSAYNLAYKRCYQVLTDLVDHGPTGVELERTKNKLLFDINERDPVWLIRTEAQRLLPGYPPIPTEEERKDRVARMTKQTCIRSLEAMLSKPKTQVRLSPR